MHAGRQACCAALARFAVIRAGIRTILGVDEPGGVTGAQVKEFKTMAKETRDLSFGSVAFQARGLLCPQDVPAVQPNNRLKVPI